MRYCVDGVNGSICDKCGKYMLPIEAYKLKIFKLDPDPAKAKTGIYITTDRNDLCEECKEKILKTDAENLDKVIEIEKKKSYNQALDDAIEFFMNHIHSNNNDHVFRNYVCNQLEKIKK